MSAQSHRPPSYVQMSKYAVESYSEFGIEDRVTQADLFYSGVFPAHIEPFRKAGITDLQEMKSMTASGVNGFSAENFIVLGVSDPAEMIALTARGYCSLNAVYMKRHSITAMQKMLSLFEQLVSILSLSVPLVSPGYRMSPVFCSFAASALTARPSARLAAGEFPVLRSSLLLLLRRR